MCLDVHCSSRSVFLNPVLEDPQIVHIFVLSQPTKNIEYLVQVCWEGTKMWTALGNPRTGLKTHSQYGQTGKEVGQVCMDGRRGTVP